MAEEVGLQLSEMEAGNPGAHSISARKQETEASGRMNGRAHELPLDDKIK